MPKPTLVILPGWGGNQETWREFIADAQADFSVICINLPCFGTEPCPSTVWGVEEYAAFVKRKLDTLPRENTVLLGHSFGGQIAVLYASKYPETIDRLILVGAAVIRPKHQLRRAVFYLIAKCGKLLFKMPFLRNFDALAKKVLYRGADSPDFEATSGIERDIFKKIIRQDLSHLLPTIEIPTLLVWGAKDGYVPLRFGKRIARLLPHARIRTILGAKHRLHAEHRETLLRHIRDFLRIQ